MPPNNKVLCERNKNRACPRTGNALRCDNTTCKYSNAPKKICRASGIETVVGVQSILKLQDSNNSVTPDEVDETILKNFLETGSNTISTGPLKYDNNCITNVRKRNSHCRCRILKRSNCKSKSQEVQVMMPQKYAIANKACAYRVKTATCGTQFVDGILSRPNVQGRPETKDEQIMVSLDNPEKMKRYDLNEEYKLLLHKYKAFPQLQQIMWKAHTNVKYCYSSLGQHFNYLPKRWAMSPYPTILGPDF